MHGAVIWASHTLSAAEGMALNRELSACMSGARLHDLVSLRRDCRWHEAELSQRSQAILCPLAAAHLLFRGAPGQCGRGCLLPRRLASVLGGLFESWPGRAAAAGGPGALAARPRAAVCVNSRFGEGLGAAAEIWTRINLGALRCQQQHASSCDKPRWREASA